MPANHSIQKAIQLIKDDPSKILGLKIGSFTNFAPGQYIPRTDAQSVPELTFTGLSPDTSYMVIALDIDAPFPSFGLLGPILHWIQPGLMVKPDNTLKATVPFVANYIGPAPPPGSSPHRYIFFLYEQPAEFNGERYAPPNGQALGNAKRMRFDLDAWESQAQLGPVLACNYFRSN